MSDFRDDVTDSIQELRKKHGLTAWQAFRELTRVLDNYCEWWAGDALAKSDLEAIKEEIRREEQQKVMIGLQEVLRGGGK